jgi:hypothetical protein
LVCGFVAGLVAARRRHVFAALTGLDLDQLVAADRMPIARALTTAPVTSTWRRLNSPLDLDLDVDLNGTD